MTAGVSVAKGVVAVDPFTNQTYTNPTFTGVSKFPDGTQGAPSIAWTSEPTTGAFRAGSGLWSVAISGAEVTRTLSSGFLTFGSIVVQSTTGGIGYNTGSGGVANQGTSKSTGVTVSRGTGQVTMNAASLAAGAKVSFVVTNTVCGANDIPVVAISSGGTANAYRANVTAVAAGSFTVTVENITGGSLSESPVVSFALIKGAVA